MWLSGSEAKVDENTNEIPKVCYLCKTSLACLSVAELLSVVTYSNQTQVDSGDGDLGNHKPSNVDEEGGVAGKRSRDDDGNPDVDNRDDENAKKLCSESSKVPDNSAEDTVGSENLSAEPSDSQPAPAGEDEGSQQPSTAENGVSSEAEGKPSAENPASPSASKGQALPAYPFAASPVC
jgi:hypothetical protein